MTGLLAVVGVILVLTASAYIGLTATEEDAGATNDGAEVTEPSQRVLITPVVSPTPEAAESDGDVEGEGEGEGEGQDAEATATPILNRENCNEIRGTQYRSPEERTWFLANCVTN